MLEDETLSPVNNRELWTKHKSKQFWIKGLDLCIEL